MSNLVFQRYVPNSYKVGAVKITVSGNANPFVCDAMDLEVLYDDNHQVLGLRMRDSYMGIEPKYNYQELVLTSLCKGVITTLFGKPTAVTFVEHEDCIVDILHALSKKREKKKEEADKRDRKWIRFFTFGLCGKEPTDESSAS